MKFSDPKAQIIINRGKIRLLIEDVKQGDSKTSTSGQGRADGDARKENKGNSRLTGIPS